MLSIETDRCVTVTTRPTVQPGLDASSGIHGLRGSAGTFGRLEFAGNV